MPIAEYKDIPVDCSVQPDLSVLKDKSVLVTGGASGLGEEYVREFAKAGAYVTLADFNVELGQQIADEFPNVHFSKCDVTIWEDQVATFKKAIANSPHKSIDIVIANAGVASPEGVAAFEDPNAEPTKPDLKIVDINIKGVLYTTKLAQHYFRASPGGEDRDRCLILKASLAGYLDMAGSPTYNVSKFGVRGLMRSFRQSGPAHGFRVNVVAPWIIETRIVDQEILAVLKSDAIKMEIATKEDSAACVLRIATDKSINGRAFGVVPRAASEYGFEDLRDDDFKEGELLYILQHRIKIGPMTRPTVLR